MPNVKETMKRLLSIGLVISATLFGVTAQTSNEIMEDTGTKYEITNGQGENKQSLHISIKIMQLHKFFQDLENQQITALLNHSTELFEMNV